MAGADASNRPLLLHQKLRPAAAAAFAGGDRSTAVASLALFVAAMEDEPGAAFLACFCSSQRLRQMLLAVAA